MCDLVLGDIYSHIIRSGEGWNASLVELTDVAKAFNISFYDVFLKKMTYYDFSPIVFDRFKFYLTNRFLTVRLVKTVSNSSLLKRGFLQGLGPYIIIFYVVNCSSTSGSVKTDCMLFVVLKTSLS